MTFFVVLLAIAAAIGVLYWQAKQPSSPTVGGSTGPTGTTGTH